MAFKRPVEPKNGSSCSGNPPPDPGNSRCAVSGSCAKGDKEAGNKNAEKKSKRKKWRKNRCFGKYSCPSCERVWYSAWCWAEFGQKCFDCGTLVVVPAARWPLRKQRHTSQHQKKKPHLAEFCEKCQLLGAKCTQMPYPEYVYTANQDPKINIKSEIKQDKNK